MVSLYNSTGEVQREFKDVIRFNRTSVTYDNNGYTGKIYANAEDGEYIDDPDNPLPVAPTAPEGNDQVDAMLDYFEGLEGVGDEMG